ncbi:MULTISPECIES: ATP-binding cassette domain-containing protein [unclassified Pseudofrankia]|uniref:ATP-binding cassette domain-containing protein n=1 Tax=unclassified Pseudofrankia TaxID=2994372 RepID=UPI0008DA06BF|nr:MULTISPECIES: ATP-binding cassette domain-containing protein [unclassified Pseudofrankia]MDT3445709.1 ATP-binding cassette domain-containing protein [Pseudofrankia sp. BMG5.37]OHV42481.1 ABC transporter [Pseudofrankia sp. BMG5.36]
MSPPASPPHHPAIEVRGIHKRFGDTLALSDLDLVVPTGTVCGLLGPNGAGKTTAVRILATLTRPDAGRAHVAGFDVVRHPDEVRRRIGFAGQHAAVEEGITGRENLRLIGRLHHLGARGARRRADELLERFGLLDAADRLVRAYSGGMRRRLDVIASLVVRPAVLFLDEPTTGLDPRSRNDIWTIVRELVSEGTTVLLTTQYLDEADRLADDIAVLDHGRLIAAGSPAELKAAIGTRVEVTLADADQLGAAAAVLAALTGGEPVRDEPERRIVAVSDPGRPVALPGLVRDLDAAGVQALDVALGHPSLDDVFLALTGRAASDGPAAGLGLAAAAVAP